jgi:hypothetical protein
MRTLERGGFYAMTSPTVRLETQSLDGLLEHQGQAVLALMTPGFQERIEFLFGLEQDTVKTSDSPEIAFRTSRLLVLG